MRLDRLFALVKRTLVPSGGLEERAIKSGIWVTLINVFDRLLQLAKIIVLARLLSPTEIGILGIALLMLAVLEQFSQFGIQESLIQRAEENVDRYLNTAWSIEIARGVLVVAVAYVAAPSVAALFGEPRSTDLIRVLALSSLLTSLQNPGLVYFRKNLDFHKQFAYTLTGSIVNTAVTIAAAFVFRSVWAFVFGRLAGNLTMLVLSYAIHRYRPWPRFDRQRAGEMIGYGKWIFGSGILLLLINEGDDAFVGWYLSAGALGLYQLAYRISNAPSTEIANVVSNVVFPTYARLQTDVTRLREGYFRTVQLTTTVSFPMAAGIVVTAPVFVRGFLGEQWLPMVLPMQILAAEGALRSLASSSAPLFKAIGRPDYGTKLQVVRFAVFAALMYPATDLWGLPGTALVIVASGIVVGPIASYLAVGAIEAEYVRLVRLGSYPAAASVVMALGVWIVRTNVAVGSPLLEFFLLAFVGATLYTLVVAAMEWRFDIGIEAILRSVVRAVK